LSDKDQLILTKTKSTNEKEIEATIDKIKSDHLVVKVKDECGKKEQLRGKAKLNVRYQVGWPIRTENNIRYLKNCLNKNEKFDVRFKQTRVPIKMEYNALAIVEKEGLSSFMFLKSVPEKIVKEIR
jgi:hypothetical protein